MGLRHRLALQAAHVAYVPPGPSAEECAITGHRPEVLVAVAGSTAAVEAYCGCGEVRWIPELRP